MRWYNDLAVRTSHSAWLFVMSAVFAFGSLSFVFMNINVAFEPVVGAQMFDFQNNLTTTQIYEQLQNYTEETFALYYAFLFIDFYFPFFAGLVLAAAAAFSWRYLMPARYERIKARNLFALFLLPTLFDWGENLFAITVVGAYPDMLQWAASGLVLCKKAKLATVMLANLVTGLSLVLCALKWLGAKAGLFKSP